MAVVLALKIPSEILYLEPLSLTAQDPVSLASVQFFAFLFSTELDSWGRLAWGLLILSGFFSPLSPSPG